MNLWKYILESDKIGRNRDFIKDKFIEKRLT